MNGMSEYTNALFVFAPGSVDLESLILACALGAVNSGAAIRLRVMETDGANPAAIHAGYVAPRGNDLEWADLVIFGLTGSEEAASFDQILDWVSGRTRPLTAWIFGIMKDVTVEETAALRALAERFRAAGVVMTDEGVLLWSGSQEDARSEVHKTGARLVAALRGAQRGVES